MGRELTLAAAGLPAGFVENGRNKEGTKEMGLVDKHAVQEKGATVLGLSWLVPLSCFLRVEFISSCEFERSGPAL